MVFQIAGGFKFLHNAGRFHGNFKLTNVLVYMDGKEFIFKLTDFYGYPGIDKSHIF